ncbi:MULTISPECIES: NAD-dependent epimerase/dehydratase family protein [unclassified Streptomyces]|uniref:NAD-dependent epimerase/dehydratase family protein n=1 Tax=unclassified Streptomyces TaxID=2593676 RepID=UPI00225BAB65|nr:MULTISPECIES: NAD-dependent epimerase/dehydratase family protein [unclassified Streptomyces]MCX4529440.1 NAD-dependent epimerase/dehydratase family protein [Streptomyces sp. NBC_01551]MCX4540010.1 NAD-dependent epimerase/dehydratase family protein [Streptomyces sp. NBC_01565]
MRLLMLGGTEFVGRAITEDALGRGWEVTVFHRGHHAPPPGTTALHGDRTTPGGLDALAEGEWDLVVDTWGGAPAAVRDSARLLAGRAGGYAYISSRSVYAYPAPVGMDEGGALVDGSPDADTLAYAEDKRGGEIAAVDAFGERALLVRAGLILGPYENVGRLPWWLNRAARGGPMLAPGPREMPLQYIDVRDLAAWTLDAAEAGLGGPYNVASSIGHATMGTLLDACVAVTGAVAEPRWTDPARIEEAGVQPWTELPIWIPAGEAHDYMAGGDVTKAHAAGLKCRPVEETAADTWAWLRSLGGVAPQRPDRPAPGIDAEREAALLGL